MTAQQQEALFRRWLDAFLALMHLDGLSYQEMGEVLGISENYIGVKLNRIRKQLADQLKGVNDEL
jgi:RNA polymerase sigma-70 factor (ECF subfamily)